MNKMVLYDVLSTFAKIYLFMKLIQAFGVIYGVLFFYFIFKSYRIFMRKFYNLECLSPFDICFISDDKKDRSNLIGFLIFENFNSEKIKTLLIERSIKHIRKLRVKMIYKYFNFYWKEVDIKEAEERIKIIPSLSTEKEVYDYVENEINKHIDVRNEMPYEIHLIPFGNENKGAIMCKWDHLLTDGLGMITSMCCVASNYNVDMFPKLMKNAQLYPWYTRMLEYIVFPYYGPIALYQMLFSNAGKTPFRNRSKVAGRVKFSISKEYQIRSFDKLRKQMGLTFNDLILGIISIAIKKLCEEKPEQYGNVKKIKCLIAVGRKAIPETISQVKISNEANALFTDINLINNIEQAHVISSDVRKSLKSPAVIAAYLMWAKIIGEFYSYRAICFLGNIFTGNVDLAVSNIPGPTIPLDYEGSKCTMMIPVVASRSMSFLSVVSYNNQFRFFLSTDEMSEIDPVNFLRKMENIMDDILSYKNE